MPKKLGEDQIPIAEGSCAHSPTPIVTFAASNLQGGRGSSRRATATTVTSAALLPANVVTNVVHTAAYKAAVRGFLVLYSCLLACLLAYIGDNQRNASVRC